MQRHVYVKMRKEKWKKGSKLQRFSGIWMYTYVDVDKQEIKV